MRNVVVSDTTALDITSLPWRNGFVYERIVVGLGILEDDVPGVQETRDVAEAAESEVDDRVRCADAHFNPYCLGEVSWVPCGIGGRRGSYLRRVGRTLPGFRGRCRIHTYLQQ